MDSLDNINIEELDEEELLMMNYVSVDKNFEDESEETDENPERTERIWKIVETQYIQKLIREYSENIEEVMIIQRFYRNYIKDRRITQIPVITENDNDHQVQEIQRVREVERIINPEPSTCVDDRAVAEPSTGVDDRAVAEPSTGVDDRAVAENSMETIENRMNEIDF